MDLLFEKSVAGRTTEYLPPLHKTGFDLLPEKFKRQEAPKLPELSEIDVDRHYTQLEKRTRGVNDGMYMLGSCTMKYNPALHEELAGLPGFKNIHPLQPTPTVQGALAVYALLEQNLKELCAMDGFSFQAAAGAQGELVGLLLMKAYHEEHSQSKRTKILVPDAAHGTNPASASMAGFEVISVPTHEDGRLDTQKLAEIVGDDTAGLMLTNPGTEGKFEPQVQEITRIVHEAGGLTYYDGANLNAIMGVVRPGDMGFDIVHLNLHKTFSTPHGGGGPGACALGVKEFLKPYLPGKTVARAGAYLDWNRADKSIGDMGAFHGNFLVVLRALAYVVSLGGKGLKQASQTAVLNANYMQKKLEPYFMLARGGLCMHEFVLNLSSLKKETGVSAKDVAKALLDYGVHPPTMYFPLTVPEALMIEPTETESRESLDHAVEAFIKIHEQAHKDAEALLSAPQSTPVKRVDEALAARKPVVRYSVQ